MPELPEVETIRRQLAPEVTGRTIVGAEVLDERLTRPAPPQSLARGLEGRRIEEVDRRGKYLLLRLEGEGTMALHLRMTGNVLLRRAEEEDAGDEGRVADLMETDPRLGGPRLYESSTALRHLRFRADLDDGSELLFTDVRRFGTAVLLEGPEALDEYLAPRVGVEPLSEELTPEALCRMAAGRTAPLKSFLLTQTGVAGIGNIYADEALHRAELHPALTRRFDEARALRGAGRGDRRCARGRPGRGRRRRSTTTATPAASAGACRTSSWSTPARASPAREATAPSSGSSSGAARPTSARAVR